MKMAAEVLNGNCRHPYTHNDMGTSLKTGSHIFYSKAIVFYERLISFLSLTCGNSKNNT